MTLVSEIVRDLGGMAQKRQLVRRGVTDHDLTRAVRSGDVVRVRNGWYSTFDEESPELRAVRVGGRLTGISAIAARGGWVLGRHPLHVDVHTNAARLRTQRNRHARLNMRATRGVVVHWTSRTDGGVGTAYSVGLIDALERVVLDEEFEVAVAAIDWALRAGELDTVDLETLILRLPVERRGIRDWVDAACESLPESLARTRLRSSGHRVVTQRPMGDGRRIDLVVEEIAAIEVDGEEYHRESFEADRGKDIDITLMGLHALRPSARMVFNDWDRFQRAVDLAIELRLRPHPRSENSGVRDVPPRQSRELAGWRRPPRSRTPEFSKRKLGEGMWR